MRLVNIQGADSVQHPEHGTAEAGPDGVFELPEQFGEALIKGSAHWRTEAEHVALAARKRLEELADPKRAAEILNFVHGRVTALENEVAKLREELGQRVSDLEEAAAPSDPEPVSEQPPAAPAKAAKATPAKQA